MADDTKDDGIDYEKLLPYLMAGMAAQSIGSNISTAMGGKPIQGFNPVGLLQIAQQSRAQRKKSEAIDNLSKLPNLTPEQQQLMKASLAAGSEAPLKAYAEKTFDADKGRFISTAKGIWDSTSKEIVPGTEAGDKLIEVSNGIYNATQNKFIKNPFAGSNANRAYAHWKDENGDDVYGLIDKGNGSKQEIARSPNSLPYYMQQGDQTYQVNNPMIPVINRAAAEAGLPPNYAVALFNAESGLDPNALGGAKDSGLSQMIPSTARKVASQYNMGGLFSNMSDEEVSSTLRGNPYLNAKLGALHFKDLLGQYGNPRDAAVAWNMGPEAAGKYINNGRNFSNLPNNTQGLIQRFEAGLNTRLLPGKPLGGEKEKQGPIIIGQQPYSREKYNETGELVPIPYEDKDTASGFQDSLDNISKARKLVEEHPEVVGGTGKIFGIKESLQQGLATFLGKNPNTPQPARDFTHYLETIKATNLPQILQEKGLISDRDRQRMDILISGTSTWDTPQDVTRDLAWMENKIKIAMGNSNSGNTSSRAGGEQEKEATPTPGIEETKSPMRINSKTEYDKLPSGSKYIDPEGNIRTKK